MSVLVSDLISVQKDGGLLKALKNVKQLNLDFLD